MVVGRAGVAGGQPVAHLADGHARRQVAEPGAAGGGRHHRAEEHLLAEPGHEVVRRGAQHETVDEVGMAPPQELGDRSAEGVPDGDDGAGAELLEQHGGVVGAVGQGESPRESECPGRDRGGRERAPGTGHRARRTPRTS